MTKYKPGTMFRQKDGGTLYYSFIVIAKHAYGDALGVSSIRKFKPISVSFREHHLEFWLPISKEWLHDI